MPQTNEAYLKRMFDFVFEAGKIARELSRDSQPSLKRDNSVVTKADKAIAELAREQLSDLLITSQHLLIEEEDADVARYLNQAFLKKTPYIWSVDPIDGTRNYANGMPNFGISIGLIKDLKPWMGVVYFPALNELMYCDGEHSHFVENAFTSNEKKAPIKFKEQPITSQSVFLCLDQFFKSFKWDYKDCRVMMQSCAAIDICWSAAGRTCGAIIRCALWDFAGAWPIALKAGLNFRSFESAETLVALDVSRFMNDKASWKLRDFYLVCSDKNYPLLKAKITKI